MTGDHRNRQIQGIWGGFHSSISLDNLFTILFIADPHGSRCVCVCEETLSLWDFATWNGRDGMQSQCINKNMRSQYGGRWRNCEWELVRVYHTHTLNPQCTKPPQAHLETAAGPWGHTSKRDGPTNSPWQLINKWQSQSRLTRSRASSTSPHVPRDTIPKNHTRTPPRTHTGKSSKKCPKLGQKHSSSLRFKHRLNFFSQVTKHIFIKLPSDVGTCCRMNSEMWSEGLWWTTVTTHGHCLSVNPCSLSLSSAYTNQYLWPRWEA